MNLRIDPICPGAAQDLNGNHALTGYSTPELTTDKLIRHVVACVNACESINATTAALEAGLIGEHNAQASRVPLLETRVKQLEEALRFSQETLHQHASNYADAAKQRDELLAAAEKMLRAYPETLGGTGQVEARDELRAIAKVQP